MLPSRPEIGEVEAAGEHGEAALGIARPVSLRSVPIEFDPVHVGIAQVQRLAHTMVAGAVEGDAGLVEPAQGIGQARPRWIEDGKVEQAGRAGGGGLPPSLSQVLSPIWWW